MLSFITLYPDNWQEHSYITLNGVYEHPLIGALETHNNLQQVCFCTDNDEGGIDGYERLRDILIDKGYTDLQRCAPEYKDWNEQLKALNGESALLAVTHFRKNKYYEIADNLRELSFEPYGFMNELRKAYKSADNNFMTELAITGSVFYLRQAAYTSDFKGLCAKLRKEYRAYTDKGRIGQKRRDLSEVFKAVERDFQQAARTREQSVRTAKLLYQLADSAIRVKVEECHIAHEHELNEEQAEESEAVLSFG